MDKQKILQKKLATRNCRMRSHFLNEFFHWEGFDGIIHRGSRCFYREGGLPAKESGTRSDFAVEGGLPAIKSVKEYIVAVEESWTAKENETRRNFAEEESSPYLCVNSMFNN